MCYSGKCHFEDSMGECNLSPLDFDIFDYIVGKTACDVAKDFDDDFAEFQKNMKVLYKCRADKEKTKFLIELVKKK